MPELHGEEDALDSDLGELSRVQNCSSFDCHLLNPYQLGLRIGFSCSTHECAMGEATDQREKDRRVGRKFFPFCPGNVKKGLEKLLTLKTHGEQDGDVGNGLR